MSVGCSVGGERRCSESGQQYCSAIQDESITPFSMTNKHRDEKETTLYFYILTACRTHVTSSPVSSEWYLLAVTGGRRGLPPCHRL